MFAICHTDGCGNNGVPVDVGDIGYTDADGNPAVAAVQCGVCGQPVTDVTDTPPAEGEGGEA